VCFPTQTVQWELASAGVSKLWPMDQRKSAKDMTGVRESVLKKSLFTLRSTINGSDHSFGNAADRYKLFFGTVNVGRTMSLVNRKIVAICYFELNSSKWQTLLSGVTCSRRLNAKMNFFVACLQCYLVGDYVQMRPTCLHLVSIFDIYQSKSLPFASRLSCVSSVARSQFGDSSCLR
jgi:hypothetical protein